MIKNILTLTLIGLICSTLLYFTNELIGTDDDTTKVIETDVVDKIDKDFKLISKEEVDGVYKYTVSKLGYVGDITAVVTIVDDVVTNMEVIEQSESYYSKITKEDYINKLLENYNNLNNVDVISGATYTSEALIGILSNTLKEHNKEAN